MKVLALVALFFCLNASCFGQEPRKTKVYFDCTCDDVVGATWATSFRDLIASSPRYAEAPSPEYEVTKARTANRSMPTTGTSMLSPLPLAETRRLFSIVVLLGYSYFVTHLVQACPHDKVGSCAANALASLMAPFTTTTQSTDHVLRYSSCPKTICFWHVPKAIYRRNKIRELQAAWYWSFWNAPESPFAYGITCLEASCGR